MPDIFQIEKTGIAANQKYTNLSQTAKTPYDIYKGKINDAKITYQSPLKKKFFEIPDCNKICSYHSYTL